MTHGIVVTIGNIAINHFANAFVVGQTRNVFLDGVDVEHVLLIRL